MGHCNLGKSVCFSRAVGWDTVAWVKVPPIAVLLGLATIAWVRVSPLAGLCGGGGGSGQDKLLHRLQSFGQVIIYLLSDKQFSQTFRLSPLLHVSVPKTGDFSSSCIGPTFKIFWFAVYQPGERSGSVVECRTPEREVRGSRPTTAVLCP